MLAAQPKRKNIAIPFSFVSCENVKIVSRQPIVGLCKERPFLSFLSVWRSPHCMRMGRCLKCYKYKSSIELVNFNTRSFSFHFRRTMTGRTRVHVPTNYDVSHPTSSRPLRWRPSSTLTPEDPSSSAAARPKAARLTATSARARDVTHPYNHLEVRAAGTPCSTCPDCRSSRCWPN